VKAYVITIAGNDQSEASAAKCIQSSKDVGNEFEVETLNAFVPDDVGAEMTARGIPWTYPWYEPEDRPEIGLRLHPYTTKRRKARMACFLSHHALWRECAEFQDPILIMEDDALWVRKLEMHIAESHHSIVGINDPRGSTRRSTIFHKQVQERQGADWVVDVPWVDDYQVPQGLAGASAYLMKPAGAWHALGLVDRLGAWPNDALLCKQLVPLLGCTRTYFTRVQRTPSTLAG
jgi:hypothetical protein